MITTKQYKTLDEAFEYFNKKLFEGMLPDVMITLQRKSRTNGYHHFHKFKGRENQQEITEIALNPDNFSERTDTDILSTLVHEMCHHWQYSIGEPSKRGYHDKEWASKMIEIGLMPSSTGEPGGKQTGQRMSHYIVEGGQFEIVCGAFLTKGSALYINSTLDSKIERQKNKTRNKFVCPQCLQAAWAKKTASLACGNCLIKMVVEEE
jgi:predicted SprT family Zn-dependent metalloprotease